MNIQLDNSEEIINNVVKGTLGEILIRCNNILYIREISNEEALLQLEQKRMYEIEKSNVLSEIIF